MRKSTYPISSLVKLHTKKYEDLQNDKKTIKDFKISKYENKKLSKFTKRKANIPSPPFFQDLKFFPLGRLGEDGRGS